MAINPLPWLNGDRTNVSLLIVFLTPPHPVSQTYSPFIHPILWSAFFCSTTPSAFSYPSSHSLHPKPSLLSLSHPYSIPLYSVSLLSSPQLTYHANEPLRWSLWWCTFLFIEKEQASALRGLGKEDLKICVCESTWVCKWNAQNYQVYPFKVVCAQIKYFIKTTSRKRHGREMVA